MSEEAQLIAAVRTGDADSLGRLYAQYADLVYGVAYRCVGSHADAEDVLQDIFVGLPEALRNYDERGRFAPWLKRVTVRTALMRVRSEQRLREEPLDAAEAVPIRRPETWIVDRITAQRAIERLPDSLRVVFMLKEVEGYSHAEIGEMLGLTSGASAARLFRAWQMLLGDRTPNQ